ncbi:MAG: hypothetical protein KJ858_05005 [Nanoarchaeota archaeon]|nr:hypothetical protein [Nanoarchaeota archaeon]
MSHAKNKVDWCLKKAEKELLEGHAQRGLVKIEPNKQQALSHTAKAEHDLRAGIEFAKSGFSDWSASAFFYSMYQSFLAIAAKFGYESGNQECTFALMHSLVEEKKIDFEKSMLDKIASLDMQEAGREITSVKAREKYQYGTELSIDDNLYE